MNYYMPYFNMYPNIATNVLPPATTKGIFSRLFNGGLNWGSILNTTQKTLGLVNQAIPVIKQVTPVMKNAKTIFKVMNEFKRVENPMNSQEIVDSSPTTSVKENVNQTVNINNPNFDGAPTFFIN